MLGGGKKVMLWVGRMSPEKGLDFLALAYNRLRRQRDDVQLVLVGDGPYREQLERAAAGGLVPGLPHRRRARHDLCVGRRVRLSRPRRDVRSGAARSGGLGPAGGGHGRHRRRRERRARTRPPSSSARRRQRLRRRPRAPARRRTAAPGAWVSPPATAPCSAAGRRPSATCARSTGRCRSDSARRGARPDGGRWPTAEARRRRLALFLLAHHDDEVFCAGHLRRALAAGATGPLLWATAGGLAPARRRIAEGARALAALGLPADAGLDFPARPARRGARRRDHREVGRTIDGGCSTRGRRPGRHGRRLRAGLRGRPPRPRRGQSGGRARGRGAPRPARRRVPAVPARSVRPRGAVARAAAAGTPPRRLRRAAALDDATSPCGASWRAPTRASSRRRCCRCWPLARWAGRGRAEPARPLPAHDYARPPHPGRLLYELYTPWRFAAGPRRPAGPGDAAPGPGGAPADGG